MRAGIMWRYTLLLSVCLSGCCLAGPLHGVKRNVSIVLREQETEVERPAPEPIAPEYPDVPSTLTLPSNATSIRNDITDNFSCDDRVYGYYADVENECQIFHVCLPVTYADGKENTFRWSFICPEETVFSQDSFTCLRREDMAITCEESVNYYELNRNFGMIEEQNANANNVQPNEDQVETHNAASVMSEQQEIQPHAASQEEPLIAPAAVPSPPQATPTKEKPVKVQKPNRRKPQPKPQQEQAMYPTNRLPSTMPLRKMPNVGTKVPSVAASMPAEVVAIPQVVDEVQVVPPRYKKRPAVTSNIEKEVAKVSAPPFKIEMVHTLSNPESFKRKRPTFAHKQNVVVTKVAEEAPAVEIAPEAVVAETVVPTINFEPSLGVIPESEKVELSIINEPVAEAAEVAPVIVEPIQMTMDAEPEASEPVEFVVESENALKSGPSLQIVPEKEAVPKITAEETENTVPVVMIKKDEPIASVAEEIQNVEEPVAADTALVIETEKDEQAVTPIEAVEEIPAVISESFVKLLDTEKLPETADSQVTVDAPAEPDQPAEIADQLADASEPAALNAASELITPIENIPESLPVLPSLEELEEQKPADAIETMSATPEMEQQNPLVEQEFGEKSGHLQTVGGFKPVDPEMAAEAEALISDFINTLKSGQPNQLLTNEDQTPVTSAEIEDAQVAVDKSQEAGETSEVVESNPEAAQVAPVDNTNSPKPVAAEEPVAVAAEDTPITLETEPIAVEEEEIKVSPSLKFPISNSFPADMYHIPVTVIQAPYEEVPTTQQSNMEDVKAEAAQIEEDASAAEEAKDSVKLLPVETEITAEAQKIEDMPAEETQPTVVETVESQPNTSETAAAESVDSQPEAALPSIPMAYRPISIDDIVELVKERLDQVPANEKGTPMELVMEPGNADKPVELKFSLEKGSAPHEESAEQTPAEDIIFPIYHRVSDIEDSDIKAQEVVTVDEPSVIVTDLKKLPLEADAIQNVAEPAAQANAAEFQAIVAKPVVDTKTETKAALTESLPTAEVVVVDVPAETETAEVVKVNRALRSRSLTKAKLDPRKRRFLFRADAS